MNLFRDSFAIDLKMLGAFRFLLGTIILWDLWGRFQIRRLVFGSEGHEGIIPIHLSASGHTSWNASWLWMDRVFSGLLGPFKDWLGEGHQVVQSLQNCESYFQSSGWIDLIFCLGFASAALFCLGLFSRAAALILWTVLLSIHHAMPMMNTGGDSLIKLFTFWSIFLPIGCFFSLDSILFPRVGFWRKRVRQVATRTETWCKERNIPPSPLAQNLSSLATTAILTQLVMIYFFSGLEKCNENWFSGQAIQTALSCPNYTKPFGDWISGQVWITSPMTWSVLLVELTLPILVFTPGLFRYTRRPAIAFLWVMHLGIALTMSIGTFSLVASVAWLLFLPSSIGNRSSTSFLLRLLGIPGQPDDGLKKADEEITKREHQAPKPRRFMADAVVVQYDLEENVAKEISSGAATLEPAAGKWATSADFLVAGVLMAVLWWNLSFAPVSVVGSGIHGSFPRPLIPVVQCLAVHDRFPMFGNPPSGEVKLHYKVDNLPSSSEEFGPKIPPRPLGFFEPHRVFLWRQYHFNLSYRPTYPEAFVKKLKLQFQVWADDQNKEQ